MKVFHINCNYLYSQLHQLLIRNLSENNCEGEVFTPIAIGAKTRVQPDNNVYVSECFNTHDRILFDYKQSKIFKQANAYFKSQKYDCIHAYTLFTDGNCAMKLSKKYGVPYVVAVRDCDINTFLRKAPYLRKRAINILKNAKAVFFLSKSYLDQLLDDYVPSNMVEDIKRKSHIIPNGIDDFWHNNSFKQRNMESTVCKIREKRLHVVFVGAISRRKNASTTLKALNYMESQGWNLHFTVVGEKEDEYEYRTLAKSHYTRLVGQQPKEKVLDYLREADIFVMPSITETFGLTYAEAMSQGLPVVYSKGQGFDKQFPEGIVGYSVDSLDYIDIADKIEKICSKYVEISSNALNLFKKFNWSDISKKYIEIYYSIINIQ